ncbi:RNAase P [Thermoplasmatales archaeon ex4572_165]|nr:MAG: RNAase P [Thermoplasmatales archaeon ex4572_165]RLF58562.1 MAG: RNAase P [Thermoplasmata archaeon]
MSKRKISKKMIQIITQKRIRTLFSLAESKVKQKDITLANRYIIHARNLSMKNVSPIPHDLKHKYCKYCYSYLYPQLTCRIRINHGRIIKQCFHCKKITRIPLK